MHVSGIVVPHEMPARNNQPAVSGCHAAEWAGGQDSPRGPFRRAAEQSSVARPVSAAAAEVAA